MKIRLVITLLLSIISTSHLLANENGELKTEFVPLYNVLPDEIIPLIRPFLAEGDVLIGSGSQLIIKTSKERLIDALAVIKRFDQPLHQLLITIIQGKELSAERFSAKAHVRGTISTSGSNLQARGHIKQTEDHRNDEGKQSIKTLDGEEAFIQTGSKQPLPVYQLYRYGPRVGVATGIQYHDVTSGFYVRPKLVGKQVRLDISPWSNKMSPRGGDIIDTSSAKTTLIVKLGEWVELGGINEEENRDSRGILSRHRSTRKSENKIFIRVEDLTEGSH
jgi:type II secretory pathway component GspD/PulD (secretin)